MLIYPLPRHLISLEMKGSEHCTGEEGGSRAAQRRRKKARKSQLKNEKQEKQQELDGKQMRLQNPNIHASFASVPPEGTCEDGITGTTTMSNKNNTQRLKRKKRDSNGDNEAARSKPNIVVIPAHDSLDEVGRVVMLGNEKNHVGEYCVMVVMR